MKDLSPEILLSVFKNLDSEEMVKVMRTSKSWLEIIDQNKSCYRRLILPKRVEGKELEILKRFDSKSNSSLQEVSMKVNLSSDEVDSFVGTLENSKDSLRVLSLFERGPTPDGTSRTFDELLWKLPHLIDCRVTDDLRPPYVSILQKNEIRDEGQMQTTKKSSPKVLWIRSMKLNVLYNSHLHLFANLKSFRYSGGDHKEESWRRFLELPSRTLKHLYLSLTISTQPVEISRLAFPKLEILDIYYQASQVFPSWMIIPSSATIINRGEHFLTHLPSVSALWLIKMNQIQSLANECPRLKELRLRRWSGLDDLETTLRLRKEKVEAGREINGVKMVPLERLVISFGQFGPERISELVELAEEVIDLDKVSNFIKIEI